MWRQPTTDDFRDAILEDELQAWQTASVADGKDPVGKAIKNAVGVFRSALRSGYKGIIGPAGTLPDDLISEAMNHAVYNFLAGRAGADISKGRETLFNSSDRTRREIASGSYAFTDPDDAEETAKPSDAMPKPSFRKKTLSLSRAKQAGI